MGNHHLAQCPEEARAIIIREGKFFVYVPQVENNTCEVHCLIIIEVPTVEN